MSVVVAVRSGDRAVIAADTQYSRGNTLLPGEMSRSPSKLHAIGNAYIGIIGSSAHHNVVRSLLKRHPDVFDFTSADALFESLRTLQPILRDEYYLLAAEDDQDQEYESNQLHGLAVSPSGVFSFQSYREVSELDPFWAIGTGDEYALGALNAVYVDGKDPRQIAEAAVRAACRFDMSSGLPLQCCEVALT